MSPDERRQLQELDDMILNASPETLKRVQQIDYQTQKEGLSLYSICVDSETLVSSNSYVAFAYESIADD